jgi:ribonuclease D
MILTDSAAVADFCAALKGAPYVAVDTEFVRERTYYAQLCLVQLAHGAHAAAIDTLAPGIELAPLHALLADPSVLKVFHAAGQDLEIFLQTTGQVPGPLFDTQIAASVCGLGDTPGYASLVSSVLGVELDKASQRTDWARRPLTPRQIAYALGDVTHLCTLYDRLSAQLAERGRGEWIAEEMAALSDARRYRIEPSEAWRRIKIRGADRRALGLLRALAAWRETTAMARDLPRPWVLHDDALVEIAQHAPESIDALAAVRAMKAPVARGADGKAILDVIRRTIAEGPGSWPEVPPRKPPIDANEPLVALLMALLRVRCDAQGVAPRIVASREDIELLAAEVTPDIPALTGWRRVIFGEDALALRAGRLAMTGSAGGVITIEPG